MRNELEMHLTKQSELLMKDNQNCWEMSNNSELNCIVSHDTQSLTLAYCVNSPIYFLTLYSEYRNQLLCRDTESIPKFDPPNTRNKISKRLPIIYFSYVRLVPDWQHCEHRE